MARAPSSISARMVRAQMSMGVAPAANSSASAAAGTGMKVPSVASVFGFALR